MLTSYGTFAVAWGLSVLYFGKYMHARGLPRYAIALPLAVAISGTGILFYRAFAHEMPKMADYALALVGTPALAVGFAWAWLQLDGAPASAIRYEDDLYLKTVEKHFYRICQVGFVIITTGIILGAVWANESWGRYWGWDPKETWAFITWLIYGVYIHGRLAGIFRGPTAAIWGVVGFNAVLFTLFGVSFVLPGLHSYLK
jgi:cytochrome c-type biogenesis protein CcsB